MTTEKKPRQDWNIEVGEAMSLLSQIRNRTDIELSDDERAALGAGRMALIQFLPGTRDRVSSDQLANSMIAVPSHMREALLAANDDPEARVRYILERAFSTFTHHFNRHRSPRSSRRRRTT